LNYFTSCEICIPEISFVIEYGERINVEASDSVSGAAESSSFG